MARDLSAPVEFLGEVREVEPLIQQAWGVVLFSRFEALTFAIQEAMWMGRAVVTSPLPSLRWLLGDGALFASTLLEAQQALTFLCQPEIAASLGKKSAETIRRLIEPDMPWPVVEKTFERYRHPERRRDRPR